MEALKTFSLTLLNQMEEELLSSRITGNDAWDWTKASITISAGYLVKLRTYISAHPFKKRSEEVFFFKKVKPLFLSQLIFFSELWNIESARPLDPRNHDLLVGYLWAEINKIEEFLISNSFLYEYYKDQEAYMDFKLFVRHPSDRFHFCNIPLKVPPVAFYGDPEFSTGYDYLFAQFKAYEALKQHLLTEYEKVQLYPETVEETDDPFGDFDEIARLFEKVASPFLHNTGNALSRQDISFILRKWRLYPPGKPTEFVIHSLFKETDYLPARIREAVFCLNKLWQAEIADVDYGDDQEEKHPIFM